MFFVRRCPGCHRPARSVCGECWAGLAPPWAPALPWPAVALTAYDDRVAALVVAAKNGGRLDLVRRFARGLAPMVDPGPAVAVTWVPGSPDAVRRRGYDVGAELAGGLARHLGLPAVELLERRPGDPPQGSRTAAERRRGPALAAARRPPGPVLVVDDVTTTGSSLRAAESALGVVGGRVASAAVVAAVPGPGLLPRVLAMNGTEGPVACRSPDLWSE